jgi:hypothetical protein
MRMAFEFDLSIPTVSEVISILTDRAKVCIDDIHYNEAMGIVDIYLQRKELTGFQKVFLREKQPIYSDKVIKSLLTIRQVEDMNIKVDPRLKDNCDSCFTVLFGLKVDDNQLYLGSAEEIQGKILCQILIKVRGMNIEICDVI